MTQWIFLEDFKLETPLQGIINVAFILRVDLRIEDAEMIVFFGAQGHNDPHVLKFQSPALCQAAYEELKGKLRS